jgi:hypothetical protein
MLPTIEGNCRPSRPYKSIRAKGLRVRRTKYLWDIATSLTPASKQSEGTS